MSPLIRYWTPRVFCSLFLCGTMASHSWAGKQETPSVFLQGKVVVGDAPDHYADGDTIKKALHDHRMNDWEIAHNVRAVDIEALTLPEEENGHIRTAEIDTPFSAASIFLVDERQLSRPQLGVSHIQLCDFQPLTDNPNNPKPTIPPSIKQRATCTERIGGTGLACTDPLPRPKGNGTSASILYGDNNSIVGLLGPDGVHQCVGSRITTGEESSSTRRPPAAVSCHLNHPDGDPGIIPSLTRPADSWTCSSETEKVDYQLSCEVLPVQAPEIEQEMNGKKVLCKVIMDLMKEPTGVVCSPLDADKMPQYEYRECTRYGYVK